MDNYNLVDYLSQINANPLTTNSVYSSWPMNSSAQPTITHSRTPIILTQSKEQLLSMEIHKQQAIEAMITLIRDHIRKGYSKYIIYYNSETEETSTQFGLLFAQATVFHLQSIGAMVIDEEVPADNISAKRFDRRYVINF